MYEEDKSKLNKSDKTVIGIVVAVLIVVFCLPLIIFFIVYSLVLKPMINTGLKHVVESSTGHEIDSVYTDSLERIYKATKAKTAIAVTDCFVLEDFASDAAMSNVNFCNHETLTLAVTNEDNNIRFDIRGDNDAVSISMNRTFTKYYRFAEYSSADKIDANFYDYELLMNSSVERTPEENLGGDAATDEELEQPADLIEENEDVPTTQETNI